uniref:non-specific serine/threonine protein kinase n=1 Tax=Chromera velia CCMP2878 TaxID=1169474 RepID=A0A0G4G6I6_9ALVE|eukprot:Cvel_20395.t1-p1 / transcript=Cvel_20395.t1 / gene=Cvel_20395 / organism=Chromera_velia_CCMP2878 / gene_product=Serine/threonine-protein kinase 38, putative / transcript_product=Serine/threonine-protein kinase 38, putative / location=Cvel_scaffold1826:9710-18121(-) / protein_length=1173 / sequence_SO=supercontig / SO=protein_coding / is_pseudo=false
MEGPNQAVAYPMEAPPPPPPPPVRKDRRCFSGMELFKNYVFRNRASIISDAENRRVRASNLEQQLVEHQVPAEDRQAVASAVGVHENSFLRKRLRKASMNDFEIVSVIGHGAFGLVYLVRKKDTGEVFALKKLKKAELMYKNQVEHVRNEKEALAGGAAEWVAALHYSFHDELFLYLVMEYLPGGDLMTHLIRRDMFTEEETKFYVAEMVMAVGCVHEELHYIHRDIKPDNILLDKDGHVKLLDFGLAKYDPPKRSGGADERGEEEEEARLAAAAGNSPPRGTGGHVPREVLRSVVGTPDYMAPEVFQQGKCGKEADWWSVGVIMFEMLFGGPPFSDAEHRPDVTAYRVARWRQFFFIPDDVPVSAACADLLTKLICDSADRLKTADEVKRHPFFEGIEFANIRKMKAPIQPEVRHAFDTQNFDSFEGANEEFARRKGGLKGDPRIERLAFHDFEYSKELESETPSAASDMACIAKTLGAAIPGLSLPPPVPHGDASVDPLPPSDSATVFVGIEDASKETEEAEEEEGKKESSTAEEEKKQPARTKTVTLAVQQEGYPKHGNPVREPGFAVVSFAPGEKEDSVHRPTLSVRSVTSRPRSRPRSAPRSLRSQKSSRGDTNKTTERERRAKSSSSRPDAASQTVRSSSRPSSPLARPVRWSSNEDEPQEPCPGTSEEKKGGHPVSAPQAGVPHMYDVPKPCATPPYFDSTPRDGTMAPRPPPPMPWEEGYSPYPLNMDTEEYALHLTAMVLMQQTGGQGGGLGGTPLPANPYHPLHLSSSGMGMGDYGSSSSDIPPHPHAAASSNYPFPPPPLQPGDHMPDPHGGITGLSASAASSSSSHAPLRRPSDAPSDAIAAPHPSLPVPPYEGPQSCFFVDPEEYARQMGATAGHAVTPRGDVHSQAAALQAQQMSMAAAAYGWLQTASPYMGMPGGYPIGIPFGFPFSQNAGCPGMPPHPAAVHMHRAGAGMQPGGPAQFFPPHAQIPSPSRAERTRPPVPLHVGDPKASSSATGVASAFSVAEQGPMDPGSAGPPSEKVPGPSQQTQKRVAANPPPKGPVRRNCPELMEKIRRPMRATKKENIDGTAAIPSNIAPGVPPGAPAGMVYPSSPPSGKPRSKISFGTGQGGALSPPTRRQPKGAGAPPVKKEKGQCGLGLGGGTSSAFSSSPPGRGPSRRV